MQPLPERSEIDRALHHLGQEWDAMECHGRLAGLYCGKGEFSSEQWLKYVAGDKPAGDVLVAEAKQVLLALHQRTVEQFNDSNLGFELLLPGPGDGVEEQVRGLAEWCQGFLLGMSEAGVRDLEKLPADSAEILRDMVDIAGAEGYELEGGDEDESAFTELQEYVRTGVLLINEELHPTQAPPIVPDSGDVTIH